MRRVWAKDAQVGQILARPVANERGVAVVQQGVKLTQNVIDWLLENGIQRIFVDDPRYVGIESREALDPILHSRLEGFLRRLATTVQETERVDLSTWLRDLVYWSRMICEELEAGPPSFLHYPNVGEPIHRWTAHVLNVALLGARTLLRIGGRDQARHMVIAAFLKDLGLWKMGEDVVEAAYITGDVATAAHGDKVILSQQIANTITGLSPYVKTIVAQHLERCDGSGKPRGLLARDIHPLAKVMAVVDAYVAAVHREVDPLLPHDALEWLMSGVGFEFDHTAVKAFRNAVHPYPVGIEVELNTGERGVVTGVRGPLAARPCVRILWDAEGREVNPYYEINLAEQTTKAISRIV